MAYQFLFMSLSF